MSDETGCLADVSSTVPVRPRVDLLRKVHKRRASADDRGARYGTIRWMPIFAPSPIPFVLARQRLSQRAPQHDSALVRIHPGVYAAPDGWLLMPHGEILARR